VTELPGAGLLSQQPRRAAGGVTLKPGNQDRGVTRRGGRPLVKVTVRLPFRDTSVGPGTCMVFRTQPGWSPARTLSVGVVHPYPPGVHACPSGLGEVGRLRGQGERGPGDAGRCGLRTAVSSRAAAAATREAVAFIGSRLYVVSALIAVPLVDVDFGHQGRRSYPRRSTMVQIWRVECRYRRHRRSCRWCSRVSCPG